MDTHRHSWLASPNVSWTWASIAGAIWAVMLLLLFRSDAGEYLESRLARPIDFQARDIMGRSPEIDPRIKIISLDDSTFSKMGSWVLSVTDWSALLTTIAAKQPRAIIIDAMFSKGKDIDGDLKTSLENIEKLEVPIITGAYATAQPVGYRDMAQLEAPQYRLSTMLGTEAGAAIDEAALPPTENRRQWIVYAASKELQKAFRMPGHFLNPGTGKIAALIRLQDDSVLAHLTLYVARERRISGGRLLLDGTPIPIDTRGSITVNWVPQDVMRKVNRSMRGILNVAKKGLATTLIEPGDVVLILPHMYTGHTDFTWSPFGSVPAGYLLASMVNSVVTGQWLKPLVAGEILVVLAVLAGLLAAMRLGALAFWVAVLGGAIGGLAFSLYLFSFHAVVVPWLIPLIAYLGAAITVFAEKTRVGEKKVATLRLALEGSVAPGDLKELLKKPEAINFEARERVVTLMFIDVVGFSLLAENMLPRIAFENLKKMLSIIGETIHSYGGIIDKTLGDGLLCYFGYRFDIDASTPDHAEKALRCAIAIQQQNLRRNIEAAENGEPVYPLRIGINTSSCYLGDLGSKSRIDFTVVGNGVNFAKRLEGACEMHSVLFGETSYDLVRGIGLTQQAVTKRYIRIKHHSELVEAYEYDPFWETPELRLAAVEGFRKCANIERVDQRWPVNDPSKIQLSCDFGEGQLVNFSHTGLSIKLKQLLAKGTLVNISLDAAGGTLKAMLAKEQISVLRGEVRWGYAEGAGFVHGVLMTNISDAQSDAMVEYLCEFAFSRDAKKDAQHPGPVTHKKVS